jgi:hypothetical protein
MCRTEKLFGSGSSRKFFWFHTKNFAIPVPHQEPGHHWAYYSYQVFGQLILKKLTVAQIYPQFLFESRYQMVYFVQDYSNPTSDEPKKIKLLFSLKLETGLSSDWGDPRVFVPDRRNRGFLLLGHPSPGFLLCFYTPFFNKFFHFLNKNVHFFNKNQNF